MIATLLLLAAAQPLHFTVSYQTAEVRTGSDVTARVLCVSARGVDPSLMTDAQRQYRDDVLRRVDSSWAGETWKGRLRLALALSQADDAAPGATVAQEGCRFLFPDETVVRVDFLLSNPTGSDAVVVEDLESGQYLAVEHVGKPSDLPELFKQLFQPTFDRNRRGQRDEAARRGAAAPHPRGGQARRREDAGRRRGQRPARPPPRGGDRRRHRRVARADVGQPRRGAVQADRARPRRSWRSSARPSGRRATPGPCSRVRIMSASALRFKGVPAIEAPSGTRVVRTSSYKDGVHEPAAAPGGGHEAVLRPAGLVGSRLLGSFPSQVERLLRGDRP